jgi:serine/threonine protein kinase
LRQSPPAIRPHQAWPRQLQLQPAGVAASLLWSVAKLGYPIAEPQLRQLLEGLAHIHRAGFVHGDLKLPNAMLHDGVVKVVDLGLCKAIGADLVGLPIRIAIGKKGLAEGKVEWKRRSGKDVELVAIADVVAKAKEAVKQG